MIGLAAVIVACTNGSPTPVPPAQLTEIAVTATARVPASADALKANCAAPGNASVTNLLEELRSCKSDLSKDSKELIGLFIELQGFKTDPEFLGVGFGVCCRFNSWLGEVNALRDSERYDTLNEVGILPVDLLELGQAYMISKGQTTEYTESLEGRIGIQSQKTMGLVTYLPTPTVNSALGTEAVGVWLDEIPGDRITIFKEGGQLRMEYMLLREGLTLRLPLTESQSPYGRHFEDASMEASEFYVIDQQGNLQIWDPYGLIATARKIK